ncbi:hypothetical protein Mapa_010698 [Marchantia paleacea]|nr:hypothetical protein Mapa_010698 [Marchantia paleacea]
MVLHSLNPTFQNYHGPTSSVKFYLTSFCHLNDKSGALSFRMSCLSVRPLHVD